MPLRSAIQSTTNLMKFQQITIKSPSNHHWIPKFSVKIGVMFNPQIHEFSPWRKNRIRLTPAFPSSTVSWGCGRGDSMLQGGLLGKCAKWWASVCWKLCGFFFGGRTCKFQAHHIDFFQLPMDTPYLADLELIHMELMKHWGPRKVEEIVSIGWGVKPRTKWSGGFLSPRSCDFFKSGKWINDPVSKWISNPFGLSLRPLL